MRPSPRRKRERKKKEKKKIQGTHLHILQTILLRNTPQHILPTAFLHLTSKQQLVQYEIRLLEIEYDIQLADVAVVFIHLLDEAVHDLEGDELVVGAVAAGYEEEGGVAAVNDFGVCNQ